MASTAEDWSLYYRIPIAYGYDAVTDDYYVIIVDSDGAVKAGLTSVARDLLSQGLLTAAILQAQNAFITGTATSPERLTDNNTATFIDYGINHYVIMPLGKLHTFTQWRQYSSSGNNGDGEFELDYWDGIAWVNWVTFATGTIDDWSSFTTEDEITSNKLRLTCTVVDTHGTSLIGELEVIY